MIVSGESVRKEIIETMRRLKICVLVPTYNNEATLGRVISEILEYSEDIIVVNDGSTDSTNLVLDQFKEKITPVSYKDNRGKGYALKVGFKKALDLGFEYAITIDSDGQHYPSDIPEFVRAIAENPGCLIIGERDLSDVEINGKSSFANKFSNFWFMVHTGYKLNDTQTGYRAYPLKKIGGLSILTSRYEAELELLVFTAWKDVRLISIPINVFYPPRAERVSHFRPAKDFTRISILNTILCILAIIYGYPSYFICRLIHKNLFNFEFKPFTRKDGKRREANLTIERLARSIYSLTHFLFWSIFVFKPYLFFSFKLGKSSEKKRLNLHKKIQRISSFFANNFPGGKARIVNPFNENFEKPALVICNHQSHLDLPIILSLSPKLIFITNDWVWNNRFFGDIIKAVNFLPITLGFDQLKTKLQVLVNEGYSIVIFPEGSRSENCKIRRFHQGAFALASELKLDIIPMVLHGAGNFLPKKDFMLRKNPQTLKILERIKFGSFNEQPFLRQASLCKKIISSEFETLRRSEDLNFHRYNLFYKYAYRGWGIVAKCKKEIDFICRNKELITNLSGTIYFFNPGIGAIPLLAALTNKDAQIVCIVEDINDFNFINNLVNLPENFILKHAVWSSEIKAINPDSHIFVINSSHMMDYLSDFKPTLISF